MNAPKLRLPTSGRASVPLLIGFVPPTANVDGVIVDSMGINTATQDGNLLIVPALGTIVQTLKTPQDSYLRLHWLRMLVRRKDGPNTFAGRDLDVSTTSVVGLPWKAMPYSQLDSEYPLRWRLVNQSSRQESVSEHTVAHTLTQGIQPCGRVRFEQSIVVPPDGTLTLVLHNPHPTENRVVSGFIFASRVRFQ